MKAKNQKDAPLSCKLIGNKIVIEIGIDTVAFSFEKSEYNNPFDENKNEYVQQSTIADKREFAKDVIRELMDEAEDGSSLLTALFDKAEENAVENGSLGLKDED